MPGEICRIIEDYRLFEVPIANRNLTVIEDERVFCDIEEPELYLEPGDEE